MTIIQTHHAQPNTSTKAVYRVSVWCEHCQTTRMFRLMDGKWVCETCREAEQGPSPWVRR